MKCLKRLIQIIYIPIVLTRKFGAMRPPLQQETIPKDRDCVIKPVITMTVEHVEIPLDDQS
ncbi:TPA: hypothetical protein ACI04H_000900 [Streptococcus agalactiae]